LSDTIVAIATAAGVGSVAIVRVSGPDALACAEKLTRSKHFTPRYAHLKNLYDSSGDLIDEAIVIWFKAPHSFTTEEVVEFQCHGGSVVAERIVRTLLESGVRLAEPGEFTRRAFLGGRIDLSEAEAVAKLIEAKSEEAAKILARQMKGELKRFVEDARTLLLRALAHAEVVIDYAEEDLPEDLTDRIAEQLEQLRRQLARIVESSRRRRGLIEGFKVAIVGKPNVGKSSLLNAMLAYERAIVSEIAGTTRDTIEESLRVGSHWVRIVDTAGIREGKDTIEKIGIERSIRAVEESDLIVALFDRSRPWDEEDDRIVSLIEQYACGKAVIVALTKTDLPAELATKHLEDYAPIALDPESKGERIIEAIRERLDEMATGEALMLVSTRQIDAVERAAAAIEAARFPLQSGELELFAFHLNEAIEALGSISRPVEFNEIMDKMFGEFCLGK
jgi:tRNA modification GTPase